MNVKLRYDKVMTGDATYTFDHASEQISRLRDVQF